MEHRVRGAQASGLPPRLLHPSVVLQLSAQELGQNSLPVLVADRAEDLLQVGARALPTRQFLRPILGRALLLPGFHPREPAPRPIRCLALNHGAHAKRRPDR